METRSVARNIEHVRSVIAEASLRAGRMPSDVRLMAVTKTVGEEQIAEAVACGVTLFGENYVQEAARKIERIGRGAEWHMIGRLQSNKAKYAVRLFDMIHSVDRFSLAEEIDRRAIKAGRVVKILIEVNLGGEPTKSGVAVADAVGLARHIAGCGGLSVQGLMTMPAWHDDPERVRPSFRALRALRDRIMDEHIPGVAMKELSMGMTDDYAVAVEEGATIVRIGRAIFGERA